MVHDQIHPPLHHCYLNHHHPYVHHCDHHHYRYIFTCCTILRWPAPGLEEEQDERREEGVERSPTPGCLSITCMSPFTPDTTEKPKNNKKVFGVRAIFCLCTNTPLTLHPSWWTNIHLVCWFISEFSDWCSLHVKPTSVCLLLAPGIFYDRMPPFAEENVIQDPFRCMSDWNFCQWCRLRTDHSMFVILSPKHYCWSWLKNLRKIQQNSHLTVFICAVPAVNRWPW